MQDKAIDTARKLVRAAADELQQAGVAGTVTMTLHVGSTLVVVESGPNHAIYQQAA